MVGGSGVVKRADGADAFSGWASRGDMTVSAAVLALRVPIGRVGPFDCSRTGEKSDSGAHHWEISRVDRNDDRGGHFAFSRFSVRVEVSGGEDANVLGFEDRLHEAPEEFVRILWEEGDREGVDVKLHLVGGEAKGQPGRIPHRNALLS